MADPAEAIESAALQPGEQVLDVACGKGIAVRLAIAAAAEGPCGRRIAAYMLPGAEKARGTRALMRDPSDTGQKTVDAVLRTARNSR